jgi:ribonuclease-3
MIGIFSKKKKKGSVTEVEKAICYHFCDMGILLQALTHSSYAYENPDETRDNELMEFLGDSVVGLITADYFYSNHPNSTEGDLSKLKSSASSTIALSEFAKKIKLDKFMRLGKGEEKSGGRKKDTILAGVFEAVVASIYLDGGYEAARDFFLPLMQPSFKKVHVGGSIQINNYKSALQEFLQKEDLPAPHYKTLTTTGPDHKREFIVEVYAHKTALAKARGRSRKGAELKAAEKALKSFFGKKIKSLTQETFIFKK